MTVYLRKGEEMKLDMKNVKEFRESEKNFSVRRYFLIVGDSLIIGIDP